MRRIATYISISLFLLLSGSLQAGAWVYGELYTDGESSVQALWHFNGNALDETANNHDGTVTGATLTVAKFGQGYTFNGNHYILTDSNELKTADDWSFSFWAHADATGSTDWVLWEGEAGGNGGGYESEFSIGFDNDELEFNLADGSDDNRLLVAYTDTSAFHFIAVTCESYSSSPTLIMYVDGIEVDSLSPPDEDMPVRADWDTNLRIGQPGSGGYGYKGILDEICIWDRTLSAAEIRQIYQYQKGGYGIQ